MEKEMAKNSIFARIAKESFNLNQDRKRK